jgi:hypothetical protein
MSAGEHHPLQQFLAAQSADAAGCAALRADYVTAVRDGRPTTAEQRGEMQRHAAAARIARRGAERNAALCRAEQQSAQAVIEAAAQTVTEEERRWLAE